jgi:hypothetical protein
LGLVTFGFRHSRFGFRHSSVLIDEYPLQRSGVLGCLGPTGLNFGGSSGES